jgi:hypothetical protein
VGCLDLPNIEAIPSLDGLRSSETNPPSPCHPLAGTGPRSGGLRDATGAMVHPNLPMGEGHTPRANSRLLKRPMQGARRCYHEASP